MEKFITATNKKPHALNDRFQNGIRRIERLSVEDCFEAMTRIMYRIIIFCGIPYFLFVLWSFIRMQGE